MEANELKIGSTYLSAKFNVPVKCWLSDLAQLDFLCQGAELDSDIISQVFEPIKLTNKWLIKSGLKKGIGIHNDRFSGIIKVVKASYMQSFELYIGNIHIKNVDYIHDAQNLFRELTDIELEIK